MAGPTFPTTFISTNGQIHFNIDATGNITDAGDEALSFEELQKQQGQSTTQPVFVQDQKTGEWYRLGLAAHEIDGTTTNAIIFYSYHDTANANGHHWYGDGYFLSTDDTLNLASKVEWQNVDTTPPPIATYKALQHIHRQVDTGGKAALANYEVRVNADGTISAAVIQFQFKPGSGTNPLAYQPKQTTYTFDASGALTNTSSPTTARPQSLTQLPTSLKARWNVGYESKTFSNARFTDSAGHDVLRITNEGYVTLTGFTNGVGDKIADQADTSYRVKVEKIPTPTGIAHKPTQEYFEKLRLITVAHTTGDERTGYNVQTNAYVIDGDSRVVDEPVIPTKALTNQATYLNTPKEGDATLRITYDELGRIRVYKRDTPTAGWGDPLDKWYETDILGPHQVVYAADGSPRLMVTEMENTAAGETVSHTNPIHHLHLHQCEWTPGTHGTNIQQTLQWQRESTLTNSVEREYFNNTPGGRRTTYLDSLTNLPTPESALSEHGGYPATPGVSAFTATNGRFAIALSEAGQLTVTTGQPARAVADLTQLNGQQFLMQSTTDANIATHVQFTPVTGAAHLSEVTVSTWETSAGIADNAAVQQTTYRIDLKHGRVVEQMDPVDTTFGNTKGLFISPDIPKVLLDASYAPDANFRILHDPATGALTFQKRDKNNEFQSKTLAEFTDNPDCPKIFYDPEQCTWCKLAINDPGTDTPTVDLFKVITQPSIPGTPPQEVAIQGTFTLKKDAVGKFYAFGLPKWKRVDPAQQATVLEEIPKGRGDIEGPDCINAGSFTRKWVAHAASKGIQPIADLGLKASGNDLFVKVGEKSDQEVTIKFRDDGTADRINMSSPSPECAIKALQIALACTGGSKITVNGPNKATIEAHIKKYIKSEEGQKFLKTIDPTKVWSEESVFNQPATPKTVPMPGSHGPGASAPIAPRRLVK